MKHFKIIIVSLLVVSLLALQKDGANVAQAQVDATRSSNNGVILTDNSINIDTNAKVITGLKQTTIVSNEINYTIFPYMRISYTETAKNYVKALYLDNVDKALKVVDFKEFYKLQGNVVVCYFMDDTVFLNEKAIMINGVAHYENYSWSTNRFLVPDKLYFVKGIDYSLESRNFNYHKFTETEKMQFELVTPTNVQKSRETLVINSPYTMEFDTILGGFYNNELNNGLFKNLTFHFTDTEKTQKDIKILMIGDSLTHMNLPAGVKQWMNRFGINATMIGTMENNLNPYADLPMEHGEGRQGWRLTDFTGINTHDGIPFPPSTALNSQYTNPFLNPINNQFDFSYYMNSQGYSEVDFVTIYAGANDILNYSSKGSSPNYSITTTISNAKTALTTMVSSIQTYNPNIKIAIIPPPVIGLADYKNYRTLWAQFVEEELHHAKTFTEVYTVGTYLTSSGFTGKMGVNAKGTVYSSINDTRRTVVTGEIHQYSSEVLLDGLWISSWIMNMLN